MEMRAAIETGPIAATSRAATPVAPAPMQTATVAEAIRLPDTLVQAMGGADNIVSASRHAGRWRVVLADPDLRAATLPADARAVAPAGADIVHILID